MLKFQRELKFLNLGELNDLLKIRDRFNSSWY